MVEEQKENFLNDSLSTFFGIVLGLVVIFSILGVLNYFSILNISGSIPLLSFLPHESISTTQSQNTTQNYSPISIAPTQKAYDPQSSADLQSCKARQQGNPLMQSVNTVNNIIVGQYEGKISGLNLSANKASASLLLVSLDGRQHEQFTVPSTATIYTLKPPGLSLLTHLQNNQKVVITFNCFTDQNNLFKITQVGIE
jgi:hypothetical protein